MMKCSRYRACLAQMRAAPEADAYVIACFDDTGLDAARCLTDRAGDRHW